MPLFDTVKSLLVRIENLDLTLQSQPIIGDMDRYTVLVNFSGDGHTGYGEDITWEREENERLIAHQSDLKFEGSYSMEEFGKILDSIDLFFGRDPDQDWYYNVRRWAFESAALDLALKQAGENLGSVVRREYRPVTFVLSKNLGEEPNPEHVTGWLDLNPDLKFKLDPTPAWSDDLIETLAETGSVHTMDFKGLYDPGMLEYEQDPELYRKIIEAFPKALLEDPMLNGETRGLFEGEEDRVSWDKPIVDIRSITDLPWEPRWLNIKPARIGSLKDLCEILDYCETRDIQLYGGGLFELTVGRSQLHSFASLFYPDGPSDIAPGGYNGPEPVQGLPRSPMSVPESVDGLLWDTADLQIKKR